MKKAALLIGFGLLGFMAFSATRKETEFTQIVDNQNIRGCDVNWGCGYFGASRSGGTRKHNGLDVIVVKGSPIYSPIDGKISRESFPYASDLRWEGLVIENQVYFIKLWYFEPIVSVGTQVKKGQLIGYAQDISKKYDDRMTTHVHVEVYKNGELIDPTPLFK